MKISSSIPPPTVVASIPRCLGLAAAVASASLNASCAAGAKPAPSAASETAAASSIAASDATTQGLLTTACYDCHSNRESAPWYGTLAPSYWFSGKAVRTLNFSAWQSYDAGKRKDELEAIVKTVESGEMPPRDYALLVSAARLTTEQRGMITRWAKSGGR